MFKSGFLFIVVKVDYTFGLIRTPWQVKTGQKAVTGKVILPDTSCACLSLVFSLLLLRLIIPLVSFGPLGKINKIIKHCIFKFFLMKYLTLRQ